MANFRKNIPSLNALVALEAAARHRSITLAAHELGVTQAAVSRQIGVLEAELGMKLFHRRHRAVEPTESCLELTSSLASSFTALGMESDEAWKAAARVRLLLTPPVARSTSSLFAGLPESFWNDPEVRWLTGVTEASGKSYFHKEALESLLAWLTLPTLVEHPESASEVAYELAASFARARAGGYEVAHTLAGTSASNGVSAAITPQAEATVEEEADPAFKP